MSNSAKHVFLLVGLMTLAACGSAGESTKSQATEQTNGGSSRNSASTAAKSTGDGPCEASSECAGDVCIALIDKDHPPVYCSEECSAGTCPDGFYCDASTFALVGLSFCRFGATKPAEPEVPEEPPRLPCKTDDDCDDGLVCAEYMGERDCTITCAIDDDCKLSVGGVEVNFSECAVDQGQDRDVCLPNQACYADPTSCVSGFPGL